MQSDLIQIAWALNIYRLASRLVGVFIPLIILDSSGRLWTIALFYLVYAAVKLCVNYSCMRIIQHKGAHLGLGLAFGFSALQTVSTLAYSQFHALTLLIIAAVGFAFTNAFLWNAQHYFISQHMDRRTKSSNIATIEIYGRLADIAGPAAGAIIGTLFGASWLLFIALVCVAATIVPLYKMRAYPSKHAADAIAYNLRGAPVGDLVANFCFNIEVLVGRMVWPIYLAIALHTYKSVGSVATLAAVASIVTTWLAGHLGDRGKDRSVLKQSVPALSFIDIARLAASSSSLIAVVSAAYESALAYMVNAWTSTYYQHAQDKGPQYIISMEIACDVAYAFFWSLFFVLALHISSYQVLFNIVFILAAVAAWGCLLITKQRSYGSAV